MKKHTPSALYFIFTAAYFFLIGAPPCLAETSASKNNIIKIQDEKLLRLERLHVLAQDHVLRNDFRGAGRIYTEILLLEPDDEEAYVGLGNIYLLMGVYKKAHDAFQNALDINPDNYLAIEGIRKILDPDGVDGIVRTPKKVVTLEHLPPANGAKKLPSPFQKTND